MYVTRWNYVTTIIEELVTHARAKYPVLAIETHEEARIVQHIACAAQALNRDLVYWSSTRGLLDLSENRAGYCSGELKTLTGTNITVDAAGDEGFVIKPTRPSELNDPLQAFTNIERYPKGALFIMADIHPFFEKGKEDRQVIRKIRDLYMELKETRKTIILVSPAVEIPKDLEKVVVVLDLALPTRVELGEMLDQAITDLREAVEYEQDPVAMEALATIEEQLGNRGKLVEAGVGLTRSEWENVVAKCCVLRRLDVATINAEKKQIIRKGGLLEYHEAKDGMAVVGGLDNLKAWIRQAKLRFTPEAQAFGLRQPRGILLAGPPGTGKSLSTKVIANELQLPMLRMDMGGQLSSKYYGETGTNVRKALDLADAVAPVVLQLDEVEKMFATGADGGHEETRRVLGTILTHFEESEHPVFRVATCNDVFGLRPEFMARFEQIFFVDLPNSDERAEIFEIHLRQVGRDPARYDVDALAEATPGFVGREIRNIVTAALQAAFYEGGDLEMTHLLAAARTITPISKQKEEEINRLRDWAKINAVPASRAAGESRRKKGAVRSRAPEL